MNGEILRVGHLDAESGSGGAYVCYNLLNSGLMRACRAG